MSRHRDVRNMDFSEDYADYNDGFGHSVDDDYSVSPSHRQFLFNRENSQDRPKIGEFIRTEQDIQEEDELELATKLSDLEKAKLESCLERIKTTLGALSISKKDLIDIIISHNYDIEKVTDLLLNSKDLQNERREKDVTETSSKFVIPKLNSLKENKSSFLINIDESRRKNFNISSFHKLSTGSATLNLKPNCDILGPKSFTVPKINNFTPKKSKSSAGENLKFNNLSDLVSNHLSKSLQNNLSIDSIANQINKISKNVNNLQIIQSSPSDVSSTSEYQIDLSVALKPSSGQSLTNRSKHDLKEEKFEISFVDCDVDLETRTILNCTFDIKDVLKIYLQNVKPISNFGKVLCHTYKRRHRVIKDHDAVLKKMPRFSFATPSPDDNIIKHLRI